MIHVAALFIALPSWSGNLYFSCSFVDVDQFRDFDSGSFWATMRDEWAFVSLRMWTVSDILNIRGIRKQWFCTCPLGWFSVWQVNWTISAIRHFFAPADSDFSVDISMPVESRAWKWRRRWEHVPFSVAWEMWNLKIKWPSHRTFSLWSLSTSFLLPFIPKIKMVYKVAGDYHKISYADSELMCLPIKTFHSRPSVARRSRSQRSDTFCYNQDGPHLRQCSFSTKCQDSCTWGKRWVLCHIYLS